MRHEDLKKAWEMEKINNEIKMTEDKMTEIAFNIRLNIKLLRRLFLKSKYRYLNYWRKLLIKNLRKLQKEQPFLNRGRFVSFKKKPICATSRRS